jgi:selenocysteine-specific elongation factor
MPLATTASGLLFAQAPLHQALRSCPRSVCLTSLGVAVVPPVCSRAAVRVSQMSACDATRARATIPVFGACIQTLDMPRPPIEQPRKENVTHLVLGVIGHVDHGKTALVRALTGMDTDRLPEEKQRGISIALGFAHLQVGADTVIDLIDMPGHERFVHTMVSGATGIDAVLLVVAANEGVKPQTLEHAHIAALLGLRRTVVAINKTDLVDAEHAKRIANETVELLDRIGLDPLPPVMTSVVQSRGIEELRQALSSLAADQRPRNGDGLPFLPIDRAFSIAGHGPVVTGTLRGGSVAATDKLELLPARRTVRVRAIQVHGAPAASALPGQRVALNLRDIEVAELSRGMMLAAPDTLALSKWLTISIRTVEDSPPLKNGMKLRAMFGTAGLDARLRVLDRDVLEHGQTGFAQLRFDEPVAVPTREHVILRLVSPPQTVAGGKVLESSTRRQRRDSLPILSRLEDLRTLQPAEMIAAEIQRQGTQGTTLQQLSHLSALAQSRIVELLEALPVVVARSGLVVNKADMDALLSRIPALLAPRPAGLSRDKLLAALPETGRAVFDAALGRLLARRVISERGSQLLIPRPDEDRARARDEVELASQIAEMLRRSGLSPPNPNTIVTGAQSKRAVDRLLHAGVIVRAVDRAKDREILFHRDAIEEAQRRLAPLLENSPGLLVTEIATALGISRKYCMPLLDHLDTIRFTRRVDDRRVRA